MIEPDTKFRRPWVAVTKKDAEPKEEYLYRIGGCVVAIPWQRLSIGASFIIPTVASASEAAEVLSPAAAFFNFRLRCEEIVWFEMTAVRAHVTAYLSQP